MQNTRNERLRLLHGALLDIVSAMNRPQGDEALLREAGLHLERALLPLLIGAERLGPVGIVELAERVGRDYTTVSRQVARLEALDLVMRRPGSLDRRVREVSVTIKGKATVSRIDDARERIAGAALASWDDKDIDDMIRLTRLLADAMNRQ